MKQQLSTLVVLATLAALPAIAQTLYISQDVPTNPGPGFQLPWEVESHNLGNYVNQLALPGNPRIDAVHRMDQPGNWLVSLEHPSNLGGNLPSVALGRDVIQYDGPAGAYSFFFCGGSVIGSVGRHTNVDAIYLEAATGADDGDLIVSFDIPTEIAGVIYDPADLVRYTRAVAGCAGWQFAGVVFDASAAGAGVATANNLIGADEIPGGGWILVFDVPTDLQPSLGPLTYVPGQVARWDPAPATFDLFDTLGGWPLSSEVDALSCQANPGRVPLLLLDKSSMTVGDLTLSWQSSCSQGAETHAIYEGFVGSYYSHTMKDCFDNLADNTEEVTPDPSSTYYLVVPTTARDEGSYGTSDSGGVLMDRPQPAAAIDRCVVDQTLTAC